MDLTLDLKSIIAIIAICVAVAIAYFSNFWRNRKSFSYEIITNSRLLTAKEIIKDDLQILYKGNEVKNIQLLILKFINTGNQPIIASDFQRHLSLVFSDLTQILSAETISAKPENLDATVIIENKKVTLTPLLLNSKDFAQIKIITSNENDFKIDARIVGVNEIKQIKQKSVTANLIISAILGISVLILFIFYVSQSIDERLNSFSTFFSIMVVLCIIGFINTFLFFYNRHLNIK